MKKTFTLIVAVYLLVVLGNTALSKRSVIDRNRCTKNDKRSVFTCCFYLRQERIMWCENSNFTRIPQPHQVKHDTAFSSESNTLFINDSCVQTVHEGELRKYPSLHTVVISKNMLKSVHLSHFQLLDDLEELDLSNNEITNVNAFKMTTRLKRLDLSDNYLSEVTKHTFKNMELLAELKLDDNVITRLHGYSFTFNKNLRYLSLTGNGLNNIDQTAFFNLGKLEVLRLDGNSLSSLELGTFSGLTSLKELSMSYNKFVIVPATISQNLPNLGTLNLANNSLTQILPNDFHNLTNLGFLALQNNSLRQLGSDVFKRNVNLTYINLERNELDSISDDAFTSLCNLAFIMLNHNRLKTPKTSWFEFVITNSNGDNFQAIGNQNPWRCDCDIIPFYNSYLDSHLPKTWVNKLQIQCQNKPFQGELLSDFVLHNIKKTLGCEMAVGSRSVPRIERRKREHNHNPTQPSHIICTTNVNNDVDYVSDEPYIPTKRIHEPVGISHYRYQKPVPTRTNDQIITTTIVVLGSIVILLVLLLMVYCTCGRRRSTNTNRREVYV